MPQADISFLSVDSECKNRQLFFQSLLSRNRHCAQKRSTMLLTCQMTLEQQWSTYRTGVPKPRPASVYTTDEATAVCLTSGRCSRVFAWRFDGSHGPFPNRVGR